MTVFEDVSQPTRDEKDKKYTGWNSIKTNSFKIQTESIETRILPRL